MGNPLETPGRGSHEGRHGPSAGGGGPAGSNAGVAGKPGDDRPGWLRRPVKGQTAAGWAILVGGILGLLGSFSLTYERFSKLINPDHVISCDMSPLLSCGSVMVTPQASLFGFPNPLLGLMAFPFVLFMGVLLLGKVRLPRFVILGFNFGALLGLVFIGWLIAQSIFTIGVLCPYCMVVWAGTIPTFWFATVYSLRSGAIPIGRAWRGAVDDLLKYHWLGLALLFVIPLALILMVFGGQF